MRVGFVGLGMMGLPMLDNLARSSDIVCWCYDKSETPFAALQDHPAWGKTLLRASTLDDLGQCQVVITMLPDSKVTNAVVRGAPGQPGLVAILKPGSIVIDMGSSNPSDTLSLASDLAAAGVAMIDAPVSGAVVKARSGQLTILVGGADQDFDRIKSLLERMGSTILHVGKIGAGHAMKALNNYVYAAGLLATSEALLIAQSMKLDLRAFAEVLNTSSGRNVATETKLNQFIIPGTFNGGFALRLMAKDLATAGSLQEHYHVNAPQLALCRTLWGEAVSTLSATADNTEIYRFLSQEQGGAENPASAV